MIVFELTSATIPRVSGPTITTAAVPNAEVNLPYSFQFTAANGLPPYTWTSTPLGALSLSVSGLMTGTPTSGPGLYNFTVTVTDSLGNASTGGFQILLIPAPSITTTSPLPQATSGIFYSTTIAATGGVKPYSWAITSNTPDTGGWSSINSSTGVLSGTPGTVETESITIQVTDAMGVPSAPTNFQLVVASSGLSITTGSLSNATVGSVYSQVMAASGGSPPYTWNMVSNSPNSLLWLGIFGNGNLYGTPQVNETESVTIQVNDTAGNTATKTFSLAVGVSGALNIPGYLVTPALPNGTNGGAYFFQMIATGGAPPYVWSFGGTPTGTNTWAINNQGWVYGSPTASETDSLPIVVTDAKNATVTVTLSLVVDGILRFSGVDNVNGVVNLPQGYAGTNYQTQLAAVGGTVPYTFTVVGSMPNQLRLSSSGLVSGTIGPYAGNGSALVYVQDSVGAQSFATLQIPIVSKSTASRPAGNTGAGYFVDSNGVFRDPNGFEFRIHGFNRNHYDSSSAAGIAKSGANACRFFMFTLGTAPTTPNASTYEAVAASQHIANGNFPIITLSLFPDGSQSSGNTSTAELAAGASWFASNQSLFAPALNAAAINLANEWNGDGSSATWKTAYNSAMSTVRGANYLCPVVIDAVGNGQGDTPLTDGTAASVLASDAQKNIVFSYHMYGLDTTNIFLYISNITKAANAVITFVSTAATNPCVWPGYGTGSPITHAVIQGVSGMTQINGLTIPVNGFGLGGSSGSWTIQTSLNTSGFSAYTGGGTFQDANHVNLRIPKLAALRASGVCVMIGEFGPSTPPLASGPSPTRVSYGEAIAAFEANKMPWVDWAWDDNNLAGGHTGNNWFGATKNGPGLYTVPNDLTTPGLDITLNPRFGVGALAAPAPAFLTTVVPFDFYIAATGDDNNAGTYASPWSLTALNSKGATYAGKRIGLIGGTAAAPVVYQFGTIGGVQTSYYTMLQALGGGAGSNPGANNAININGGVTTPTYIGTTDANGNYSPRTVSILPTDIATGNRTTAENALLGQAFNAVTNKGNVVIDGLVIHKFFQWAIAFFPASASAYPTTNNTGIVVQNCEIYDGVVNGNDNGSPVVFQACAGAVLRNCKLHDCVTNNAGNDCAALYSFSCHSNLYEFNTVYNTNLGLYDKNTPNGNHTHRYNFIESITGLRPDAINDCVGGQAADTTTVHHSILYSPSAAAGSNFGSIWSGAGIGATKPQGVTFYNNTCICATNGNAGVFMQELSGAFSQYNNIIINQTTGSNGLISVFTGSYTGVNDFNTYDSSNHDPRFGSVAAAGTGAPTLVNLATWKTNTGKDANSRIGTDTFAGTFGVQVAANYQLTAGPSVNGGKVGGVSSGATVNCGAWDGLITQIGSNF